MHTRWVVQDLEQWSRLVGLQALQVPPQETWGTAAIRVGCHGKRKGSALGVMVVVRNSLIQFLDDSGLIL